MTKPIFKIPFPKHVFRMLKDDELDFEEYILENWSPDVEDGDISNEGKVRSALFDYHMSDGGHINVDDIEIDEIRIDYDNVSGNFKINYNLNQYYGCDDMNNNTDLDIEVHFYFEKEEWNLVCMCEFLEWTKDYE